MSFFPPLLSIILTLFLLMICGYICRKVKIIDTNASKALSRLIISVGQPMMIISALANAEYNEANLTTAWQVVLISLCMHSLMALMAFLFSTLSILLILSLCTVRAFSPNVVVLSGMAIGSVWTAATTILQFYATDVGLSAAVIWNFGDLGRATYRTDGIMVIVVSLGALFFNLNAWKLNALLSGEATAKTMGINVEGLRFTAMLLASVITAVCVSFLGVIGFVGIICPHVTKKLLGQDHRVTIPVTCMSGSLLLLFADTLSRSIGNGSALPVGAITSLLGAPFFIAIIFSRKENRRC